MTSRNTPPPARHPLRRTLHCALIGLTAATAWPAVAQPAPRTPPAAEQGDSRHFDIAAGTLSDVLARFAGDAGVALTFDAAPLRGLESQGLQGRFSTEQGFARLLEGSGFEAAHKGSGNYLLRQRPVGESTLAPVNVTATTVTATTEGLPSYSAESVTLAKGTQRIRDIPQSVSVVTRQRIEDQNLTTVAEAMRQTVGMTVSDFGSGTAEISSRGFQLDSIQVDGSAVQTGVGMWGTSSFDLALYDRVEVMRGPAGILQGSGEPGGAINLVRKRAHAQPRVSLTLQGGSWDRYRSELDATGALTGDGRLRARFVAAYEDAGSFIDKSYARKPLLYGTLEYDLSAATTLSAGITTQRMTSRPYVGLPVYPNGEMPDLPRSTYLGSDWDKKTEEAVTLFAEAEHRFDDGGEAHLRFSRIEREFALYTSAFGDSLIDPATGDMLRRALGSRGDTTDTSVELHVTRPFSALGREHRFTVGASTRSYEYWFSYENIAGLPQNAFDPDHSLPRPAFSLAAPTSQYTNTQHGLFGQLQLRVSDLTQVVVGGRLSHWKTDNKLNPGASYRVRDEFTPALGLIHDLSPAYSVYASYAGIFQPQNGQTVSGSALDPRTGEQYEIGLKGDLAGGRATLHAALFRINDENRAMTDPDNPGFSISSGKVRSEGFETELAGQITPKWNVSAGYAYTKTRNIKANPAQQGLRFAPGTPEHSVKIWNTLRVTGDQSRGWTVGGGLEYNSGLYAESSGVRWKQDAYTVAAASAAYRFDRNWSLALNVENLFDKKYFSRVSAGGRQNYYGNPRNFMLTLRGQF